MAGFRKENNFRELGGYKAKDGRTVRKGMFYRSGALADMSGEELAALKRMGLKTVLDLRSRLEQAAKPDPPIDGATNYHISAIRDNEGNDVEYSAKAMLIMALKEPGLDKMASLARHLYGYIAFDSEAYKKMFELMLAGRTPMLFHCRQGKDRTGVAAILILLALGVDEETILDDYVLTNKYRSSQIKESLNRFRFLSRISRNMHTFLLIQEGVDRSFGEAVITSIRQKYPSYEAFFKTEYDLAPEDLERLRDLYLE